MVKLDDDEIETGLRTSERIKALFSDACYAEFYRAKADGTSATAVMTAIVVEALMLAAHLHHVGARGTDESFIEIARCALKTAKDGRVALEREGTN